LLNNIITAIHKNIDYKLSARIFNVLK